MNKSSLEFDLADRMRRALRVSDVSVQEMADYMHVSRNTVGNWINGRNVPRWRDLRDFAERTGVPLEWLETGRLPEVVGAKAQPSDYKSAVSPKARPLNRRDRNTRPSNRAR
jgi:transcriptional regulator with XRE-family HTH domain